MHAPSVSSPRIGYSSSTKLPTTALTMATGCFYLGATRTDARKHMHAPVLSLVHAPVLSPVLSPVHAPVLSPVHASRFGGVAAMLHLGSR